MKKQPTKRITAKQLKKKLPTVSKATYKLPAGATEFPITDLSYSSAVKFTANPYMFKVNNINGDTIETTSTAASVLGRVVHEAMKWYFGGGISEPTPVDESEAVAFSYNKGKEYLDTISDGLIRYNTDITNRAKLEEKYSTTYFGYVQEFNYAKRVKEIELVEQMLRHHVEIDGKVLPIALKGSADLVYRDEKGRLVIWDHKIVGQYSRDDEIDWSKMLQAAFNYHLVAAELGEAPHKIVFGEYKHKKNQDKSKQLRLYEFVYKDMPIMFELFNRLYGDIVDALMGKQVFVPNLQSLYDREVSVLAYVHRLDVDEERAKQLQHSNVTNITELLKEQLANEKTLKRFSQSVSQHFVSAKTLNYKDMTTEDKIRMKLAEHGIAVEFHSKVVGGSVTLYRYEPSIGVKMARVEQFTKDIEQAVGKTGVRVLAPIPDSEFIGFEIPNAKRTFPGKVTGGKGFELAIGVDVMGATKLFDIREAPHMLVAGAPGSGKSMFTNTLIEQLIQEHSPNVVQLALLDPKMVEFQAYENAAHTLYYKTDIEDIESVLAYLVREMNKRYETFKSKGVKKLEEYRSKGGKLPYIFVFIDEFGDLIISKHKAKEYHKTGKVKRDGTEEVKVVTRNVSDEIRKMIILLGQKARAAGIHVILTTQRPSVQIVDGAIKANFPTRAAFRTASATDSQVIIDTAGAEKLLGKGDMLFLDGSAGITRLQGFSV